MFSFFFVLNSFVCTLDSCFKMAIFAVTGGQTILFVYEKSLNDFVILMTTFTIRVCII